MTPEGPLFTAAILIYAMLLGKSWKVAPSKQNLWITSFTLCLSVAAPNSPFFTCLVGLPADQWLLIKKAICNLCLPNKWIHNPVGNWDYWAWDLLHPPLESQELEILGSAKMDLFVLNFITSIR